MTSLTQEKNALLDSTANSVNTRVLWILGCGRILSSFARDVQFPTEWIVLKGELYPKNDLFLNKS